MTKAKISNAVGTILAMGAFVVAVISANTICNFIFHQPEAPAALDELKF